MSIIKMSKNNYTLLDFAKDVSVIEKQIKKDNTNVFTENVLNNILKNISGYIKNKALHAMILGNVILNILIFKSWDEMINNNQKLFNNIFIVVTPDVTKLSGKNAIPFIENEISNDIKILIYYFDKKHTEENISKLKKSCLLFYNILNKNTKNYLEKRKNTAKINYKYSTNTGNIFTNDMNMIFCISNINIINVDLNLIAVDEEKNTLKNVNLSMKNTEFFVNMNDFDREKHKQKNTNILNNGKYAGYTNENIINRLNLRLTETFGNKYIDITSRDIKLTLGYNAKDKINHNNIIIKNIELGKKIKMRDITLNKLNASPIANISKYFVTDVNCTLFVFLKNIFDKYIQLYNTNEHNPSIVNYNGWSKIGITLSYKDKKDPNVTYVRTPK